CGAVVGANGAVGMCMVQAAVAVGAVVVAEAADAPAAAAVARGVDVLVDTTGRVVVGSVPEHLNTRGRIVVIAGRGRADLDLWSFYVREIQLLGFVMSAMTVAELAAAAAWINSTPTVSVGRVLGFDHAAQAHALIEDGRLPRMDDGTVGRLVLVPAAPD
ncbi:MAG: zinc-binding dehydrogenase, partial [Solirubrobacteraceae bacterium]